MAHDHVWVLAVRCQQFIDSGVNRQHGRLCNRGLHQVALDAFHSLRIMAVHEDVAGERLAQDGRHHAVALSKDLGDHRIGRGQLAPHVGILAALTREEEGYLARFGAAAAEDALALQRLPGRGVVKTGGLTRFAQPVEQLIGRAKVNDQALLRGQVGRGGRRDGRRPAIFDATPQRIEFILELNRRRRAHRQDTAQRRLGRRV